MTDADGIDVKETPSGKKVATDVVERNSVEEHQQLNKLSFGKDGEFEGMASRDTPFPVEQRFGGWVNWNGGAVEAGSTQTVINSTGHEIELDQLVTFSTGNNQRRFRRVTEISADSFTVGEAFPAAVNDGDLYVGYIPDIIETDAGGHTQVRVQDNLKLGQANDTSLQIGTVLQGDGDISGTHPWKVGPSGSGSSQQNFSAIGSSAAINFNTNSGGQYGQCLMATVGSLEDDGASFYFEASIDDVTWRRIKVVDFYGEVWDESTSIDKDGVYYFPNINLPMEIRVTCDAFAGGGDDSATLRITSADMIDVPFKFVHLLNADGSHTDLGSGLVTFTATRPSLADNASTEVIAANASRKAGSYLVNNTSGTFFLQYGAVAVLNQGIPLTPGSSFKFDTTQQIRGIQNSGGALSLDVFEAT